MRPHRAAALVLSVVCACVLAAAPAHLWDAEEALSRRVPLKRGQEYTVVMPGGKRVDVRTEPGVRSLPAHVVASHHAAAALGGRALYVVHVKAPVGGGIVAYLDELLGEQGAVGGYYPHHSYTIFATAQGARMVAAAERVVWVGPYRAVAPAALESAKLIDVILGAELFHDDAVAEDVLARWATEMLADVSARAEVSLDGSRQTAFVQFTQVEANIANAAAAWLVAQPGVLAVSAVKRDWKLHNSDARWIVQSGMVGRSPLTSAGLDGRNEIIGMGDTGIDVASCYFADLRVPTPINVINYNHRKIIAYMSANGDTSDTIRGHGTHCAGAAAGAANGTAAPWNGMAAGAKLYFMDLSLDGGSLNTPLDLYGDYLQKMYQAGARVALSPWGAVTMQPDDIYSRAIDRFAQDYPELLAVFSAGDGGTYPPSENGYFQVTTPGTAKNALSVGASFNGVNSWSRMLTRTVVVKVGSTSVQGQVLDSLIPYPDGVTNVRFVSAVACAAPATSGLFVIMTATNCDATTMANSAQTNGALGVILGGDEQILPSLTIPAVFVAFTDLTTLYNMAANPVVGSVVPVAFTDPVIGKVDINSIATFSSNGPSYDIRYKPDVFAPGYTVFSALSGMTRGLNGAAETTSTANFPLSGTSVSASLVAGVAAQVRQYFKDGYYSIAQGRSIGMRDPTTVNNFSPTGALVKAVIINSGQSMTGAGNMLNGQVYATNVNLPNVDQGFGRIEIANTLPIYPMVSNLFVVDANASTVASVSQGTVRRYCFRITNSIPFKVTLVWYDPPQPVQSTYQLVNDLDLIVSVGNDVTLGNMQIQDSDQGLFYSTDTLNTVEQVTINAPAQGDTYTVSVVGANVASDSQNYALVVSGGFSVTPSCTPRCVNGCGGTGVCINGVCNCKDGSGNVIWAGADCSHVPLTVQVAQEIHHSVVASGSWSYFKFPVSSLDKDIFIEMRRTSTVGDPDLYIKFGGLPSLRPSGADFFETACDPCGDIYHIVRIDKSRLQTGMYYIGVYGYCCDQAAFDIVVHDGTPGVLSSAAPMPILSLLAILSIAVLVMFVSV